MDLNTKDLIKNPYESPEARVVVIDTESSILTESSTRLGLTDCWIPNLSSNRNSEGYDARLRGREPGMFQSPRSFLII